MKSTLAVVVLLLSPLALRSAVAETPPEAPSCCACLPSGGIPCAAPPSPPVPALFCAEVFGSDGQNQFGARCQYQGGGALCLTPATTGSTAQDGDNLDCKELLLARENIACPTTAPAPLLDLRGLGGLGLLLAGLGAWTVRRRRA